MKTGLRRLRLVHGTGNWRMSFYAAMMAHGEEAHSNMFEGKSPEDLAAMKGNDGRPRPSDDHRPKLIAGPASEGERSPFSAGLG